MDKSNTIQPGICLLGATGSIGGSTLDILEQHPNAYKLIAVTANRDIDGLFQICQRFQPNYAVMADQACGKLLSDRISAAGLSTRVLTGTQGLIDVAVLDARCAFNQSRWFTPNMVLFGLATVPSSVSAIAVTVSTNEEVE